MTSHPRVCPGLCPSLYLLSDEAEALVGPGALVGLSQNGVEGLAARPVVAGRVSRHRKRSHVNLHGDKREACW